MANKKSNLVERRLYEYTLHAVTTPFYLAQSRERSDQLVSHVAKLFNVILDEHEQISIRTIKKESCNIVLSVDVKQARNLLGEDQNGLSDPYCEITIATNSNSYESVNLTSVLASSTITTISTPPVRRRSPSLFSCVRSSSPKDNSTARSRKLSRQTSKTSSQGFSMNRLLSESFSKAKASSNKVYHTKIQPKTVNPEWNEHFDIPVENAIEKYLLVKVYDSDGDHNIGLKTVVREKRGVLQKFRGIQNLLKTGRIDDDFLGFIKLDIKALATFDGDQWFSLRGLTQNHSHINKSRGEILLGLKIHFKLIDQFKQLHEYEHPSSDSSEKEEKPEKMRQQLSNMTPLEFHRGYLTVPGEQTTASIIRHSSIFRKNFRAQSSSINDRSKLALENDFGTNLSRCDSCLTPTTDTDSPLLIEEYHQLTRIVVLHELEDTRDASKSQPDDIVIDWSGALNPLSNDVLLQFRVLYNLSILSDTLILLLVIMELRCSDEYAKFISQGVIEGYSKPFLHQLQLRTDVTDIGFTDYEKTAFNNIFHMFIGHYIKRVNNDALWFLPSTENLANIESIFNLINILIQLKICSNESIIRNSIEETIKHRIQTDINDSLSVRTFFFEKREDISLAIVKEYLQYVIKIANSMSCIGEYQKLFSLFNINYIKECYFGRNSAGDRLTEITICLLTSMKDYFQSLSKPIVTAKTSIYNRNWIEGSKLLLNLYLYLDTIVTSLRKHLSTRDWEINAFKLRLNEYREWFSPCMVYLLEGFIAGIRQAMERATEDEHDSISTESDTLRPSKAVAATMYCIQVCREWEEVDYPDMHVRYTGLIKLTNTLCEQCQHYARRIVHKLLENEYFTDLNRTESFNVSKKLCTLVNDIEYVKTNLLSSLPILLNFSSVIEKVVDHYQNEDFRRTQTTLERLIATAEREMNDVIELIFEHVAKSFYESLRGKIRTYYQNEKNGKADSIKAINQYIDQAILKCLHDGLEKVQYSRVASAIRIKALQCFTELFPHLASPEFYKRVLNSFDQLSEYFEVVCRERSDIPGPVCEEEEAFRKMLKQYTLSTEELQLLYFVGLTKLYSNHEHSNNNGEIIFRTAYENVNELIVLHVEILSCRNLPKMDFIGASDPYVIAELLPATLFPNRTKPNTTEVIKWTLNPEYNKLFTWHRLPKNILTTPGAVLRLSVWDKDVVVDDFIGECFVRLGDIEPLGNRAGLRDVPVLEVHLKRPHRQMQPSVYKLILMRKSVDTEAAKFIAQRSRVMDIGTGSDDGSMFSDDRHSSGLYNDSQQSGNHSILPKASSSVPIPEANAQNDYHFWNILQRRDSSSDLPSDTLNEL